MKSSSGTDELHRPPDSPRDFEHLVVERRAETATEASTHERNMHGYIPLVDAKKFRGVLLRSATCCVGDHISQWPCSSLAVMFIGSMVACAR